MIPGNSLQRPCDQLHTIIPLLGQCCIDLTCDQSRYKTIQHPTDYTTDDQGNQAVERIGAGDWLKITKRMQKEQEQRNDAKTDMPVQVNIECSYGAFT